MFRKKIEIKVVDDIKSKDTTTPSKTRPTPEELEAAKQALIGGAFLFLTKIAIDAATEITVASIKAK